MVPRARIVGVGLLAAGLLLGTVALVLSNDEPTDMVATTATATDGTVTTDCAGAPSQPDAVLPAPVFHRSR